jgi:hypothetical protein
MAVGAYCFALAPADSAIAQQWRNVATETGVDLKTDWFDGSACSDKDSSQFHFQVGKQVFVLPPKDIVRGLIKNVRTVMPRDKNRKMTLEISRTAGCKTDPLAFAEVLLKPAFASTSDDILLFEKQEPVDGVPLLAKYIQHLNQTGACKKTSAPNLVVCLGSRTVGGKRSEIAFFLPVEADQLPVFPIWNVPIHARCEPPDALRCTMTEELKNGVSIRTSIEQTKLSAEIIRQAREKLVEFAAAHSRQ